MGRGEAGAEGAGMTAVAGRLEIVPTTIKAANRTVAQWHRHCRPVQGALWAHAVERDGALVGVAIVGRPARMAQDGRTCAILRVTTDGTYNACTKLYGACRRVAKAMGYKRIRTHNLKSESGASLRAAGFRPIREIAANQSHSRPSRHRYDRDIFGVPLAPEEEKIAWECLL